MPRRYAFYDDIPIYKTMHFASSIGAFTLGIGIAIALAALIMSLFKGEDAPDNPWGASTLDWQCQSPPVHENFEEDPVLTKDPYYYN